MNNIEKLKYQILPDTKLILQLEQYSENISVSEIENGSIEIYGAQLTYMPPKGYSGIVNFVCKFNLGNLTYEKHIQIKVGYSFKAKSHILSLLGDELIGSDNLAIFELIKNAYDADATLVTINLLDLNTKTQSIIIEDNGNGMSKDVLKNIWMEIGTDFKRGENRRPSPIFKRISLGEKGVGRLAIHKLGRQIILETQARDSDLGYRINFNWGKLISEAEFIEDTFIEIQPVYQQLFNTKHGTRIILTELRKDVWTKKDLRDLARKINSIISPFKKIDKFEVRISANDFHQNWFDDVKDVTHILSDSLYFFKFSIDKNAKIEWTYEFKPPVHFGIPARSLNSSKNENFLKLNDSEEIFEQNQKLLRDYDLQGIGPIEGQFYVYNLLSPILNTLGQASAIKAFVKENSGVRVFRNGIRVYNYGESSDDWLGLDLARVQKLGEKFSKNTVIGAIDIDMLASHLGLIEKTNREGFDENLTFKKFRSICNEVFDLFQRTAISDREKIKSYLDGIKPIKKIGFSETLNHLKEKLKEKGIDKELTLIITRVEKDYNDMRDVMLNSGMTGLNLGLVFHEVDREMKFINSELENNKQISNIKERVKNLILLLENFSPILKQNKMGLIKASELAEKAKSINGPRFSFHDIVFSSPLITHENFDFQINGPINLLLSSISNLLDNAIYWTSIKKEMTNEFYRPSIFIGSDIKTFVGPAIIVADNGTGFNIEPEDLTMPFRTTRPGGMGLGLYFVNMVMEMIGGKLLFPDPDDLDLPVAYSGAVVALVFPVNK